MTNAELIKLAEGWIAYWIAPPDSPERQSLSWVWDQEYYLMQNEIALGTLLLRLHNFRDGQKRNVSNNDPYVDEVIKGDPMRKALLLAGLGSAFLLQTLIAVHGSLGTLLLRLHNF